MGGDFVENLIEINGKAVDLMEVFKIYGKNRLGFTSYLASKYGATYKEAKELFSAFIASNPNLESPNFMSRLKAEVSAKARQEAEKKMGFEERRAALDAEGVAYCPKCLSTSLTAQKKGFGFGKAAAGAITVGGLGLLAGGIGANKVEVTCLKCGHKFTPGK